MLAILFYIYLFSSTTVSAQADFYLGRENGYSIEYRCGFSESEKNEVKLLVEDVITESLAVFETVNPLLYDRFKERLQQKKLVVICEEDQDLNRAGSSANYRGGIFTADEIRMAISIVQNRQHPMAKNLVLHELLHFAKIDNLSTKRHNELPRIYYDRDAVYSCADLVYANLQLNLDREQIKSTCKSALHVQKKKRPLEMSHFFEF